jgi:hypothetical protein
MAWTNRAGTSRGAGSLLCGALAIIVLAGCGSSASGPVNVTSTQANVRSQTLTMPPPATGASTGAGAPTTTTTTTRSAPVTTTRTTRATTAATTTRTGAASVAPTPGVPTTSFATASSAAPGAGPYPPGVQGSACAHAFVSFSETVTDSSADAAYKLLAFGLSCPAAAAEAVAYLKTAGTQSDSSQAPPRSVAVRGFTCGSYWYRPAGDHEDPEPFVTCVTSGKSTTFFGSGD